MEGKGARLRARRPRVDGQVEHFVKREGEHERALAQPQRRRFDPCRRASDVSVNLG